MRPAAQARDILAGRFVARFGKEPPWPALWILLAQSRQEGSWGAFGGDDAEGTPGGENWGAVQAKVGPPCPPGTFEAGDSAPSSTGQKPFRWCFLAYESAEAGADDFLRHALTLRPSAMAPLLAGDVWNYARILREQNYYGGFSKTLGEGPWEDAMRRWEQIGGYVDMIDAQGAIVNRDLGMPTRAKSPKPAPPKPGGNQGQTAPGAKPRSPGRPLGLIVTMATIGLPLILRK
jgi:hypothetical protein